MVETSSVIGSVQSGIDHLSRPPARCCQKPWGMQLSNLSSTRQSGKLGFENVIRNRTSTPLCHSRRLYSGSFAGLGLLVCKAPRDGWWMHPSELASIHLVRSIFSLVPCDASATRLLQGGPWRSFTLDTNERSIQHGGFEPCL